MKKQISISKFFAIRNNDQAAADVTGEKGGSLEPCHKEEVERSQAIIPRPIAERKTPTSEAIKVPFHPDRTYEFKKTMAGKQKRSCNYQWFIKYPWLHYAPENDSVICFICFNHNIKNNMLSCTKQEPSFTTTGFSSWKKAIECFNKHQDSECHKVALSFHTTVKSCKNIIDTTNINAANKRKNERNYLIKVVESLQYLARQGIPLQGHDGNDNFTQLLLLRSKDDKSIRKRLAAPTNREFKKYTHDEFQNELLEIMARQVLNEKISEIKESPFFALIADEYTDISNKEQLSICIRWIHCTTLTIYEDFLGFYEIQNIKSDTIVTAIKDAFVRFQLSFSSLRGQTYDGASNMIGAKSGVATQIKAIEPNALETHCHAHSVSLAVKETTTKSKVLRDTLDTVGEMCVLIKFSPKREKQLEEIQKNVEVASSEDVGDVIKLDKLCLTRWTVRAKCLAKVIELYDCLFTLFDECIQEGKLSVDIKSRIIGCIAQMKKFDFYFGITLGKTLYGLSDNLSKALQIKSMSALNSQKMAELTISTVESMRSSEEFQMFYETTLKKAKHHDYISEPQLPRKRKKPNYSTIEHNIGFEDHDDPYYPSSAVERYRQMYYEIIDLFLVAIKERFRHPTYEIYAAIENVFISFINNGTEHEEGIQILKGRYERDIDVDAFLVELSLVKQLAKGDKINNLEDIKKVLVNFPEQRNLLPNVTRVYMLLAINPATSATAERSFSLARRIKTWNRSAMMPKRFNSLSILNCHKTEVDNLDVLAVANEFVSKFDERKRTFGLFVEEDFNVE